MPVFDNPRRVTVETGGGFPSGALAALAALALACLAVYAFLASYGALIMVAGFALLPAATAWAVWFVRRDVAGSRAAVPARAARAVTGTRPLVTLAARQPAAIEARPVLTGVVLNPARHTAHAVAGSAASDHQTTGG